MQMRVPAGAYPGMTLQIQLSDGHIIGIQLPPGVAPGSMLQFEVPPAPPANLAAVQQQFMDRSQTGAGAARNSSLAAQHNPPMLGLSDRPQYSSSPASGGGYGGGADGGGYRNGRTGSGLDRFSTRSRLTDNYSTGQVSHILSPRVSP